MFRYCISNKSKHNHPHNHCVLFVILGTREPPLNYSAILKLMQSPSGISSTAVWPSPLEESIGIQTN